MGWGFWNVDNNGRLHELSETGGTNPMRNGPVHAGRVLGVLHQDDNRVIVQGEKGIWEHRKGAGTWNKVSD